jgi:hypothetical protein
MTAFDLMFHYIYWRIPKLLSIVAWTLSSIKLPFNLVLNPKIADDDAMTLALAK